MARIPRLTSLLFASLLWTLPALAEQVDPAPQDSESPISARPEAPVSQPRAADSSGQQSRSSPEPPGVAARQSGDRSPAPSWIERVEQLQEDLLRGRAQMGDGSVLYEELRDELSRSRGALRQGLDSGAEVSTLTRHHDAMEELYDARLLLLQYLPPEQRLRILSLGPEGVREAKQEFDRLQLHMRFQVVRAPATARTQLGELSTSPIPLLKGLFYMIVAVLCFRIWRRWASHAIPDMRQQFLSARPRTRHNIRMAKILWYFDRIRTPLEWLALMAIIASVGKVTDTFQDEDPVWRIIKWVFIGWFGLRWVDALAARGAGGLRRDDTGLRLRSLRLICIWVVTFGLGLDLAGAYVGQGTVYSWVWWALLLLALPLVALLCHWWRDEVFRRMSRVADPPVFIQRLVANSRKRKGYLATILGAGFLMMRAVRRRLLSWFGRFDVGKRALAHVMRREVARQAQLLGAKPLGQAVPQELQQTILRHDVLIEEVHREALASMIALCEEGHGRTGLIMGERGIGKSTLLARLQSAVGSGVVVVDSPMGTFEALHERICAALSIEDPTSCSSSDLLSAARAKGVRVICVDNLHRLARPVIGGFGELDRFVAFAVTVGEELSWVLTFDSAAWQYVACARSERALANEVTRLKPWSESQIAQLLSKCTEAAGLDPDFDHLVLPRQLDESVWETGEDRNQYGFVRILWDSAEGNPAVALRLWCESLRKLDDGRIIVQLYPQRGASELGDLNQASQFALRSVVQMEYATMSEILDALRIQPNDLEVALRYAKVKGLLEEEGGYLHLTWPWFRGVTRMLTRKNLLTSE